MGAPSKHTMRMIGKIRTMNPAQIYQWALVVYQEGYKEGMRAALEEYDAIVVTEDEAISRLGEEAFNRFIGGTET